MAVAVAGLPVSVEAASAAPGIQPGIYDDAQVLFGNPDEVFLTLSQMHTRVLRVTLWWSGPSISVATRKPAAPADPADPAYRWDTYDRAVRLAKKYGIKVMCSVMGTPGWANGGMGWNAAPTDAADLQAFVTAAAKRYSGRYTPPGGIRLGQVKLWVAWNEPNNPVFLKPQYVREGGTWAIQSARDYARICNAVVAGVRKGQGGAKIACGATAPRGNNNPNSSRPSTAPVAFLLAMRKAGARGFNAYAHHPYYGKAQETPSTPPPPPVNGQQPTAVTLGNFAVLEKALKDSYGSGMRIWITEYGYQTNPPDRLVGVTPTKQAAYMQQAWDTLKANPRVDMFVWFLMRDEERLEGWQSGVYTVGGKRKPSRETFENLIPD